MSRGIEKRRCDARRQRHIHRPPGVADGAQHPRQRHAERERHVGGYADGDEARGDHGRFAMRVQDGGQDPVAQQEHRRRHRGGEYRGDGERGGGETPRARPVAGAKRARDRGRGCDGEADVDRHDEERDQADIADRGLERLIAELRHPEQRQKIDDEHRHQADGAGGGHDRDMAHQRPVREHGPLVVRGAGGVQVSFLSGRGCAVLYSIPQFATRRDLRFPRISAGARSRLPFSWIDSDP